MFEIRSVIVFVIDAQVALCKMGIVSLYRNTNGIEVPLISTVPSIKRHLVSSLHTAYHLLYLCFSPGTIAQALENQRHSNFHHSSDGCLNEVPFCQLLQASYTKCT